MIKFDHAEVIDDLTVDIFYDCQSVWALSWCRVPILPKHIWEGKNSYIWDPQKNDAVIGTGPFRCFKDGVMGRPDHVPGVRVHLVANPTYFRKFIWPDACGPAPWIAEVQDEWVDIQDFMCVAFPGRLFSHENPDGTWPTPPGVWGPYCDVSQDGRIGITDLLEIAVHMGEPWPPPWYVDN